MKGDIIIVEEHHRNAANQIVPKILSQVKQKKRPYHITVAGESGSGKSETAKALAEVFEKEDISVYVIQQDDYFVLPPKSNDAKRRKDPNWRGTMEVDLKRLDSILSGSNKGKSKFIAPLVIYEDDKIVEEEIDLGEAKVVIAEGTYTTLLENVDCRVFITRNRLETMESRKKRGREAMDPFIEEVLKVEHEIISKHKTKADIIITKDYDVDFSQFT